MNRRNPMKTIVEAMSKWDNPPIHATVNTSSDEPTSYEPLINDRGELIVTKIEAPKLDRYVGSIKIMVVEDITDG